MERYSDAFIREDIETLRELSDLSILRNELDEFEYSKNIEFYEFLSEKNFTFDWFHLAWAIHRRDYKIIDYLLENHPNCIYDEVSIDECGDGFNYDLIQNLDVADYLIKKNAEIFPTFNCWRGKYMARLAVINNEVKALDWLKNRRVFEDMTPPLAIDIARKVDDISFEELMRLAEYGNSNDVIEWLKKNKY